MITTIKVYLLNTVCPNYSIHEQNSPTEYILKKKPVKA